MKKLVLTAAIAVVALGSCQKTAIPTASLKTGLDTLSYELGMVNSDGLKEYLVHRVGIDTTYMADFFRGLVVATQAGDDKKQAAYFAGIQIGQRLGVEMFNGINQQVFAGDSTKSISLRNLLAGFIANTKGKTLIPMDTVQVELQQRVENCREESLSKTYAQNKEIYEKFLVENKSKEGVKVTKSG